MDRMLTLMQIAALVTAGTCHALLGSVKVPLARKLAIDEARVGGLVSIFGFTLIPAVLAAGFLVDSLGKQAVVSGGFLLVIASLVTLSRAQNYSMALGAVLLLGAGWSALVNVLNVTTPPAFITAEPIGGKYPRSDMTFAMNLGDFIFGMGAFMTPILISRLVPRIRLDRTLLVPAALAAVPLLLGFGVDWERLISPPAPSGDGGFGAVLADPIVLLCCAAFFCHVPVEASVAAWATTLLTDKGVGEAKASTLLSVFWLTFTSSRLVAALALLPGMWLAHWMGHKADTVLITTLAVLSIGFTLGIAFSRSGRSMGGLIVAAGMILGPIFPTLIAILLSHVDPAHHGRTVGIFFCIGGIGWTAIPLLVGAYARRTSVQRAFLICAGCATLLTTFCIALDAYLLRG
jgi:fucose permease